MAFLHSHSCEAQKSEIDIFSLPPTQTSIDSSLFMQYNPVSALSQGAPIEFLVVGNGSEYIDLAHTMLRVRAQISPNNADDNTKVAPVNNFLHSLFNQVDVFFNHKQVSQPNNSYPYRAYLEDLFNFGRNAKESHLRAGLWITDTAGKMEALPDAAGEGNKGMKERQTYTLGAKTVDLIGHLHCDVFNQNRFLINGVDLKLRLIRSSDNFSLMDSSVNSIFSVNLLEASLIIRKVKINPGVLLSHASMLAKTTAKYPVVKVDIKSFTINSGVTGETIDNIIIGALPKRIIIGFVDNKAFNGDRKLNPFNFQHFNLNYLSLYVDGQQLPTSALQPNFDPANPNYIDSYLTLFSGSGIHYLNEGNTIDRKVYPLGYSLHAFDLSADLSANCSSHWNLIKHGTVRLEVRFKTPLAQTINCLIYAEHDNVIEIDSNRQVIVDYSS